MAKNMINSLSLDGTNVHVFSLPYGVCDTGKDVLNKIVQVDHFPDTLEPGAIVIVKFTDSNNIASPTLNVNGTGDYPIVRYVGAAASTGTTTTGWRAGVVQMFVFDQDSNGGRWIRNFWENTTYSNVSLGQGYATCSTAAATAAKTASLSSYALSTGGIVSVKFTNGITVQKPTLNINSKGAKSIYYAGAALTDTTLIKANDIVTMIYSSYYHIIAINGKVCTAGTYGPSVDTAGDDGVNIAIPQITVDSSGRVTAVTNKTYTSKNTTYSDFVASGENAAAGLVPKPSTTAGTSKYLREDGSWQTPPNTKNTTGATNTSNKIFLVGATAQESNPVTYTHDTAYVGTDGCLYSGGSKVLTSYTDTKNTAGSTNTNSKIFLIGATSQATNPQTYSHGEVFVDTDHCVNATGFKGGLNTNGGNIILSSANYGTTLATDLVTNELFFVEEDGYSIPAGGSTNQILAKRSNTSGDVTWVNNVANGINTSATTSRIYITGVTSSTNASLYYNNNVYIDSNVLMGAAWNDYAEYRICKDSYKPGQVICENGDDTLSISTERMQPGAEIISDTFGMAIGETADAKCPVAISGRVLAYTFEPREEFKAGDAVCAGPNGTISKMTRKEIREYPDRIIGTVSAIPDYNIWNDKVIVDNRIWIKVK